uniref:Uncharacterized protein n=1 Tax=Ceratitis capitata TaxID=7213 RepID=W8CA40_CERCA
MNLFMFYGAALLLLTAHICASSTPKAESRISVPVKPKREAPLSSSGYHGPSYKYLPPAPVANSYNSYSSHGSSSLAGFGSSSSAGLGYDLGAGAPKIETYIVQTEPAYSGHASHGSASYSGSGSSSSSNHFGGVQGVSSGSAGGSGYRYSNGGPHFSAGGSTLLGHSSHSGGGNYKHYTKARPHIQTFIVPASSLAHSSGGGSSAGHHATHFGGTGSSGAGYQYTPSFGSTLHSTAGVGGFGSAHNIGFGGASFGGHSGGSLGTHGGSNSVSYNPQQGYSYSGSNHGGNVGTTLSFTSQGSHSGAEYAHSAPPSIPSTSYGVPAGPAVTTYHQGAGHSFHSGAGDETPAYAVGHKGLGHFGFSASKPHALNTNFISSSSSSHGDHSSRAPFKPSTLLGTTYEVSAPGSQYLPPTSPGYEYQTQAILHSGATATGSASAHVNEPDSGYLPPISTPGGAYLPPHQH